MESGVLRCRAGPEHAREREIRDLIAWRLGPDSARRSVTVYTDTTDFFNIEHGDVLLLGGRPYYVRGNMREGRFGLDDEPKLWVKSTVDVLSGDSKIIKLSFLENFRFRIGSVSIECVRSPRKEARILALVDGDSRFMQGFAVKDEAGNIDRVLEYIRGPTLADVVLDCQGDHETYFHHSLPILVDVFISLAEAIAFLHRRGEKHGDIRRDHVMMDRRNHTWRWIDFDYNYHHPVNPFGYDLFGLGNILAFLVGRGDVSAADLAGASSPPPALDEGDMNIIFRNRVANLRKIYPHIPEGLNRILMHFSAGAETFYQTVDELLEDLGGARDLLGPGLNELHIANPGVPETPGPEDGKEADP